MTQLPKSLYKYQKFDEYALTNLQNSEVFFNRPIDFNDPFDCSVFQPKKLSDSDIIEMWRYTYEQNGISIKDELPQKGKEIVIELLLKSFEKQKQKILYEQGCYCLSNTKENILMWSHYANAHTGFCLEFDTSYFSENSRTTFFKVDYTKDFPRLDAVKLLKGELSDIEKQKPLYTKYEEWEYEEEWRLFIQKPQETVTYPKRALKSVSFGTNIKREHREIIGLIIQAQYPNTKFYRGYKDDSSYVINFDKVDINQIIK
jgi:hypothetical protein